MASTSALASESWAWSLVCAFLTTHWISIIFTLITSNLRLNKYQPGLVNVPGPPLAAYTKLWRVYDVCQRDANHTAIKLHRKYGPLVRIGPNHVSVADPRMISVIYTNKGDFTKTGFYPIASISWKKRPAMNIFSTRDPQEHRNLKRKVANAYTLLNLLQSEEAIDSCSTMFMSCLSEFASRQESVDLGAWLQYYAFVVVGELNFASKLGFLEQGMDVDGMMKAIEVMLAYGALCGQVPEYHK